MKKSVSIGIEEIVSKFELDLDFEGEYAGEFIEDALVIEWEEVIE